MLDNIIIQQQHKDKAKYIFKHIKNKEIISIGGGSGTGKTEVALCLQDLFLKRKKKYQVISEDNFYNTHWRNRNRVRKLRGIIGLQEIAWEELETVIGVYRRLPCYDGVIVEGLYTNYIHGKDIGIFLEGTIKQTDKFRRLRKKEFQTKFRQQVLQVEYKELNRTKALADIVVPWKI